MPSVRWNKVARDLWSFGRARTVLVVLSVSVGVFALGAVLNAQITLDRDLEIAWRAVNPAGAVISTSAPFGDDLIEAVRGMHEVDEAEARRSLAVRIQAGPGEWRDAELFAIADYDDIRVNVVRPVSGDWPPGRHEVLIERAAAEYLPAGSRDTLRVRTAGGLERRLHVAGLVHDPTRPPAFITGSVTGYVTWETMRWLGQPREYDQILVTPKRGVLDRNHLQEVAALVRDKVEKAGYPVLSAVVPDPTRPPFGEYLLLAMAVLVALVGAFGLSGPSAWEYWSGCARSASCARSARRTGPSCKSCWPKRW